MIDELISAGRYEDALKLLSNVHNENQAYQKILCLYSLKRYNEARIECEILKEYAEKNYYDVIAIYVTILIEMDSLDEAKHILEEELSMPYVPSKYEKIFNETYDELLKRGRENSMSINIFDTISDDELSNLLITCTDKNAMFMLLEQLEQRNIRRLLPALEKYLKDENKARVFKTIIIESLASQNVNQEFIVIDKNETFTVNPCNCLPVMEMQCIKDILSMIEKEVGNKDISFVQYCGEVLMGYIGNVYPNEIKQEEYPLIITSIIIYVDSLIGNNSNYGEILISKYNLNESKIDEMLLILEKMMIL